MDNIELGEQGRSSPNETYNTVLTTKGLISSAYNRNYLY